MDQLCKRAVYTKSVQNNLRYQVRDCFNGQSLPFQSFLYKYVSVGRKKCTEELRLSGCGVHSGMITVQS
jgi:hypothetical protein